MARRLEYRRYTDEPLVKALVIGVMAENRLSRECMSGSKT